MTTITMLTDFGLKDGNVGVMKGVIWNIAPDVKIADLSHHISPQNIEEASLVLFRSAPYFPPGTIHLVVVDPGVGTERRPIAAQLGEHFFVGPDNGVITQLLDHIEGDGYSTNFVQLNNENYWLPDISSVFHGRDIFAPTAAHLAAGIPLTKLGTPISSPYRLKLSQPERSKNSMRGEIIHIDHFGNISTNIRREHLNDTDSIRLKLCGENIDGLVRTFGDRPPGSLVVLYGSTGSLIVSVVNGSAADRLNAKIGDEVELTINQ